MIELPRRVRTIASVMLIALLAACAGEDQLIISAAASLTNAFTELGHAYEREYPGRRVVMNFAGSGSLLRQLEQGAPVDVFASADQETMDRAQQQGLIEISSRTNFAGNQLVLIAPGDSKLKINKLEDLQARNISRIAISNPETVPAGRYAKAALRESGMWDALQPRLINTQHVRQSLDYVARGEADAGFVYVTDVVAASEKVKVLLSITVKPGISYPVAVVTDSRRHQQAREFIEFLESAKGQSILQGFGFGQPG